MTIQRKTVSTAARVGIAGAFAAALLGSLPSQAEAATIQKDLSFGCEVYLGKDDSSAFKLWYKPGDPNASDTNQDPFPVSISATAPDKVVAGETYSTDISADMTIPVGLMNATRGILQGQTLEGSGSTTITGTVNEDAASAQTITGDITIPVTPVPQEPDTTMTVTGTGSASGLTSAEPGDLVIRVADFKANTVVTKADGTKVDVFITCTPVGDDVVGNLTVEPAAPEPTETPTPTPTDSPTSEPTGTPTSEPTGTPTSEPTGTPTSEPTGTPTSEPTGTPTSEPTGTPTSEPTDSPTSEPTGTPTTEPTGSTTPVPTGSGTGTGKPEPTGSVSGPVVQTGTVGSDNNDQALLALAGLTAAAGAGFLGARRRLSRQ